MNDINPYLNRAFYFLFYHSIRMYVEINSKISWMLKIDFFPTSLAFLFKDRFSLSQNSKSCFSSIWHKIRHNVYTSIDIEFNNSFLFLSLSLYRALRSGDENPGIFPRPYVEKGASSCSHRKIGGECRRGCCLQDGGEGEFIIL